MLDASAYPHPAGDIKLLQTHISYVVLAGEYAYKIKKAVDFGFVNYSTLGRRRYYCGREVALNRRLCSGVYLGVVPIRDDGGAITVVGKRGRIVEYAVRMKRVPEERMMHNLLAQGAVTDPMVGAVAAKIASFHQSAATSRAIARYGDWAVRYNCAENVRQWQPYIGRTITREQDTILRAYFEAFYARKAGLMRRRVEGLRVKHCHSDLRSDAVFFSCDEGSPDCVCILDCVEFNRRLMYADVARDVGFLAMDLNYRGHAELASDFVAKYQALAGDPDLGEVLPYYSCYNACVRSKVESILLDLPEVPEKDKRAAAKRARRYFALAVEYARSLPPAFLVITCGLSASGKSTVAERIAGAIGAEVVSSDVTRKRLAGVQPGTPATADYRAGIYSPRATRDTYSALIDAARARLVEGRSVVLDATYLRRDDRKAARRLAKECGAQFACLAVSASEAATRVRMETRDQTGGVSDARWSTYLQQKRHFQRPTEIPPERMITVDTTHGGAAGLARAIKRLRSISPLSVP
jgi:aminoglycoside phosphotransferase family enzyme/predicted kinase